MKVTEIISIIRNSRFLKGYALSVLLINLLLFFWAMSDDAVGLYVVLLVVFPLDMMLLLFGIIRTIVLYRKKSISKPLIFGLIVFLLPVISGLLVFELVWKFAKNGGC